jgi:hypothetical protein
MIEFHVTNFGGCGDVPWLGRAADAVCVAGARGPGLRWVICSIDQAANLGDQTEEPWPYKTRTGLAFGLQSLTIGELFTD